MKKVDFSTFYIKFFLRMKKSYVKSGDTKSLKSF